MKLKDLKFIVPDEDNEGQKKEISLELNNLWELHDLVDEDEEIEVYFNGKKLE